MKLPHFIQRRPVAVKVLVVVALVAVVWAGYSAYRRANLPKDCVSRLVLVDEAITRWAIANKMNRRGEVDMLAYPTEAELVGYLDDPSLLKCPDGGKYVFGTRAEATTCSRHGHASLPEPVPRRSPLLETIRGYFQARVTRAKNSCIANLKQMDGAKQQWAFENSKLQTDTPKPGEIMGGTLYIRSFPICPNGGKYTLGRVQDPPLCTVVGHTL